MKRFPAERMRSNVGVSDFAPVMSMLFRLTFTKKLPTWTSPVGLGQMAAYFEQKRRHAARLRAVSFCSGFRDFF